MNKKNCHYSCTLNEVCHEITVRTGQPGTSCVIPDEFDGLNCSDLVVARPNPEKIDSYYLAFYLNSMAKQYIGNQLVGAIQQHFNIRSAKEMIIHLPSLNEQLKNQCGVGGHGEAHL